MDLCFIQDCSGYRIGYVAGLACLVLTVAITFTSNFFESELDLHKSSAVTQEENLLEIKSIFSFLGYSLLLVCFGAIAGVEIYSWKLFLLALFMFYLSFTELYRPYQFTGQEIVSYSKRIAYVAAFFVSVWVLTGAWWW